MKNVILDCFRRWRIPLTVILIAYFVIEAISIRETNGNAFGVTGNIFTTQIMLWFGFLLMFDFRRGTARALTILPLTAKQIGRSLWLASVLLPALALLAAVLFAFLLFSAGTNRMTRLNDHLMYWLLASLYLGAIFGAQTLMPAAPLDKVAGRVLPFLYGLLWPVTLSGFFFAQLGSLTTAKAGLLFIGYLSLSVTGWVRAEQLVGRRVSFRPPERYSAKQPAHTTAQDFGGLYYLLQRTFIQFTLMGLALVALAGANTIFMSLFFHAQNGQIRAQAVRSMINEGTTFYLFVLLFSIVPIVFQLRFLRTLPISPSVLAATFVFLPLISIATVGLIVTVFASLALGGAVIRESANSFLALGAKAAIIISLIVWRGLDVVTYVLVILLMVFDSFAALGMTMIFHLSDNSAERPLWMNLAILLLCAVLSFELTRRLISKNSNAYRVRTMQANIWSAPQR